MKEVKSPKKPLIYYYGIVLLVLLLFNILVAPLLLRQQVIEVDYSAFMNMIDEELDKLSPWSEGIQERIQTFIDSKESQ